MPKKVCTTQPGDSACCVMAQQGLLGRPVVITTRTGSKRCFTCTTRPSTSKKHPGVPVFQPRFLPSATCGIGARGCAALAGAGGAPTGFGGPSLLPPPQAGSFAPPAPGFLTLPGR